MKTLKLLGIIALSALIIIWVTGCEDLFPTDELTDLEGTLTIMVSSDGAYVGNALRANYVGDEDVTYQWFRGDTSLVLNFNDPDDRGFQQIYTPLQAGNYQVRVNHVDDKNNEYPKFASNGPVAVTVKSTDPTPPDTTNPGSAQFIGIWKMTGASNGGYLGGVAGSTLVTDELMTITATTFRVQSTNPGLTSYNPPLQHDLTSQYEYISYDIVSWNLSTSNPVGFQITYKLIVSNPKYKGYTVTTANATFNEVAIYLYLKADGTLCWGNNRTSTSTFPIWGSAQNQNAIKDRIYVKQPN